MNHRPDPATPPVPGAHPDDDSVAGEEDPGASVDEPPQPMPVPAPRDQPAAPGSR